MPLCCITDFSFRDISAAAPVSQQTVNDLHPSQPVSSDPSFRSDRLVRLQMEQMELSSEELREELPASQQHPPSSSVPHNNRTSHDEAMDQCMLEAVYNNSVTTPFLPGS